MDWQSLHDDFTALAATENRFAHGMRFMYADDVYENFGEFGNWKLLDVPTEKVKVDFELLATRGGIGLGLRDGALPLIYWLHNLFRYLKTNSSALTPVGAVDIGRRRFRRAAASRRSQHPVSARPRGRAPPRLGAAWTSKPSSRTHHFQRTGLCARRCTPALETGWSSSRLRVRPTVGRSGGAAADSFAGSCVRPAQVV